MAALIRAAFAAQSVKTDPLPSALRVTEADVAAHRQTGGGVVAEVEAGLVGAALWVERDGGLYLAGWPWPRPGEAWASPRRWWQRRNRRHGRWACPAYT